MRIRLRGKRKNEENYDLIVKKNLIWTKEISCKLLRYATVFGIVAATSMSLCGCDYSDMEAYYDLLEDIDTDKDIDISKILDENDISTDDLEDISDLLNQLDDSSKDNSDEGKKDDSDDDKFSDLDLNFDCNKDKDCNNNDCNDGSTCDKDSDCNKDKDCNKDDAGDQSTECDKDKEKDTGDDRKKDTDQNKDCDPNRDSTENTDSEQDTDKNDEANKEDTDSANNEDSSDKPDDSKGNVSDQNGGEPLPDDGRPKMDAAYEASYRGFDDDYTRKNREAAGITDASIDELKKQQEGYYAYSRLSDAGKTLYVELLQIINKEANEIFVSTRDPNAIQLAFDYLMMDHPEIFWVNGYRYVKHFTNNGGIDKLAFTGVYTYDLNEVANRQAKMQGYIDTCLAGAPSTEDEYFVVKYIYDYLIANTEYDLRAPDNQNICSVFLNGKTVCSGYARASQYLLNKLGIKCTYVTGMADNGSGSPGLHAWNLVRCNGDYYYMDTTWGDTGITSRDGRPRINYDYLCATEAAMSVNHKLSDRIDYPDCTSTKDSYYVRENRYMESPNLTQVEEIFAQEYESGSDNVTVKCESKDTYNSLYEQLIKDGAVYDYLQGDKKLSYTLFEDSNTIAIWLN
ncbi:MULTISPECIES: transglutaminase domain-containing protein [unclassified Butyrivibrio]|uniref:transglutaminase domain-containing protein n=1 Tax=unclassified Butyrivibrio TaxID=2639466 RepID=UPI00047E254E|nr:MULTISPECIES: transglutaminase domain-containing protein [unclassified Butyrivibrio]